MLDQETTEFLILTANNVVMSEKRWKMAKLELKLLRADLRLETDWVSSWPLLCTLCPFSQAQI